VQPPAPWRGVPVQSTHDLQQGGTILFGKHLAAAHQACSSVDERQALGVEQWAHPDDLLAAKPQALSACHQNLQGQNLVDPPTHDGCCLQQALEVVEQEHHGLAGCKALELGTQLL
jgi:hypothetical protein